MIVLVILQSLPNDNVLWLCEINILNQTQIKKSYKNKMYRNLVKICFLKKKIKQETLTVQFRETTIGFHLLFVFGHFSCLIVPKSIFYVKDHFEETFKSSF